MRRRGEKVAPARELGGRMSLAITRRWEASDLGTDFGGPEQGVVFPQGRILAAILKGCLQGRSAGPKKKKMKFGTSWESEGVVRCRGRVADPEQLWKIWLSNALALGLSFHRVFFFFF